MTYTTASHAQPQAPLVGTVKYRAGTPKPSNYPPHELTCNIVVTLPDGTDSKIWGPPEFLQRFQKGQQLPLVRSPKGGIKIDTQRLRQQPQSAPVPTPPPPVSAAQPPAIASEIAALTALWASCYSSAKRSLAGSGAPAEAIQAAASSAYIQMTRHHGIDALVVADGAQAKNDMGW